MKSTKFYCHALVESESSMMFIDISKIYQIQVMCIQAVKKIS